jgi:hypothetical protein
LLLPSALFAASSASIAASAAFLPLPLLPPFPLPFLPPTTFFISIFLQPGVFYYFFSVAMLGSPRRGLPHFLASFHSRAC